MGTAYVALFNYAWAKKNQGRFILRIEDTDRERSNPASERMIFESLRWLGLSWDEGPDVGGPHAPYRQSERLEVYQRYAEELMDRGAAYPCFCSKERLDALREEQRRSKSRTMGYDRRCRSLPRAEAEARRRGGEPYVVRLAMPTEGMTQVRDLLRGELAFDNQLIDDQVLLKSDGYPTYHLANVVDDHLMGITHVIRAEEWLSSLPKHVQLYRGFGWEEPIFCHLPLLRNADRSKISKRKNPTSLNYYRRAGFLPETMRNYLALMGWTMPDGREEFSLEEFVENLTLERIVLGGPVFDLEKLTWLNGRYLRNLTPEGWLQRLRADLFSDEYLLQVVPLVRERIDKLEDFLAYGAFFFVGEVSYDAKAREKLIPKGFSASQAAQTLDDLLEQRLDPLLEWRKETLEGHLRQFAAERGMQPGDLFMSVRVAVTGRTATPPLFETMEVLGKEICRRRLRRAAQVLKEAFGG